MEDSLPSSSKISSLEEDIIKVYKALDFPVAYNQIKDQIQKYNNKIDRVEVTIDNLKNEHDPQRKRKGKTGNGFYAKNHRREIVLENSSSEISVLKIEDDVKPIKISKIQDSSDKCSAEVIDLTKVTPSEADNLFENFVSMFPDISKDYLRQKANEYVGNDSSIEQFIDRLSTTPFQINSDMDSPSYSPPPLNLSGPHRVIGLDEEEHHNPVPSTSSEDLTLSNEQNLFLSQVDEVIKKNEWEDQWVSEKHETLSTIFPKTDPQFLYEKVLEHLFNDESLAQWTNGVIDQNGGSSLPSLEDYEKRQKSNKLIEKYSREGDVEELVKMYGDPIAHFSKKSSEPVSYAYKQKSLAYLCREFRNQRKQEIELVFARTNFKFLPAFQILKSYQVKTRKTKRQDHACIMPNVIDITFLKEYQVAMKEQEISEYLNSIKKLKMSKFDEAKKTGALITCNCCFDDECLKEEMISCPVNHAFCKSCVVKGTEVAIGEGSTSLSCFENCSENFKLSVLQEVIPANLFSKWLPRIQNAEIKDAEMEGLTECPFCPYMTIMDSTPEQNKILLCRNPECGKESCRLCKEISHIPLRCEEVEKNCEVRKRTFIENKMTEALLRTCPKCSTKFYKTDGCNQMTCKCKATICYLCRKLIKNGYNHFYGQGSPPIPGKCPLFSDNKKLMEADVAKGALEARKEAETIAPGVTLKHDPTGGKMMEALAQQPTDAVYGPIDPVEALFPPDVDRRNVIRDQERAILNAMQRRRVQRPMAMRPPRIVHNPVNRVPAFAMAGVDEGGRVRTLEGNIPRARIIRRHGHRHDDPFNNWPQIPAQNIQANRLPPQNDPNHVNNIMGSLLPSSIRNLLPF